MESSEVASSSEIELEKCISTGVQSTPTYALHQVNTDSVVFTSTGVSHTEGCWPRDVDPTDGEQVARWRKRTERDEDYLNTALRLGSMIEDLVLQNNALDIYTDYFADAATSVFPEAPFLNTITVLKKSNRALHSPHQRAHTLSWCPDHNPGKLAVAYTNTGHSYQSQNDLTECDGSQLCVVYDISKPLSPVSTLLTSSDPLCMAYSWKDIQILGIGTSHGECSIYDLRQGSAPIASTLARQGHINAVTGFAWVQSRTGTEFMTASLDGTVCWWDSRKLSEKLDTASLKERNTNSAPVDALGSTTASIPAPIPANSSLPATCLEYSTAAGPTKFMVGTGQGTILSGNRKSKSPYERVTSSFVGHAAAIKSLSRHSQQSKYFLSAGDWSVKLWSEDIKTPLLSTPFYSHQISACAWSTQRCSVFYCATENGHVQVWDLLQSNSSPVLDASMADVPLTSLAIQEGGRGLLAVGCSDGLTMILQPSKTLEGISPDERAQFSSVCTIDITTSANYFYFY